jgi:hypothetical protein
MATVGGISLEMRAIKGGYSALCSVNVSEGAHGARLMEPTHIVVAGPEQFLGSVESKRRDLRGRMMGSCGRQLSYGNLVRPLAAIMFTPLKCTRSAVGTEAALGCLALLHPNLPPWWRNYHLMIAAKALLQHTLLIRTMPARGE